MYFWRNEGADNREAARDEKLATSRTNLGAAITSTVDAADRLVNWLRTEFATDVEPDRLRDVKTTMRQIMGRAKEPAE